MWIASVPEGVQIELFVDGVLMDRGFGAGDDFESAVFAPAEDTEPHQFTVDIEGIATLDCDTVAALPAFARGSVSCQIDGVIDGIPQISHNAGAGEGVLVRDGAVIAPRDNGGGFADHSVVPSTRYSYAIRFVGAQPTLDIPCGTVRTPARTVAQRLATARHFEAIRLAPYVYVLQRPTCPGCSEPFKLYSTASAGTELPVDPDTGEELEPVECEYVDFSCWPDYRYEPPFAAQGTLPAGHPGLHPPRALGARLDEAIRAGKDVDFTTDGMGAFTSWTIDGYGAEITCTEFDTRPPELHSGSCTVHNLSGLVRDAPFIEAILGSRDTPGAARGILRLYNAYFGRAPDVVGARYWVDVHAGGYAPTAIAEQFIASEESRLNWGAETTADFVDRIYANVFGRAADPAGAAYWTALLDDRTSRGAVLWWFAQSIEFRTLHSYSWIYLDEHREALVDP